MLGAVGGERPRHVADHDDNEGHAYAVWSWNR
jgi:hypothetical protein